MLLSQTSDVLSELLLQRTGIAFTPARYEHLANCLRAALRDLNYLDEREYVRVLQESTLDSIAWQRLLHHLAIGETYFFRNAALVRETILPGLIERRRNDGSFRLRIWSAGCATGEEPYTIAMILRDMIPDIDRWQITIIGSDINMKALEQARRGRYVSWSVRGPVNTKYLRRIGEYWEVSDTVRQMVDFRFLNLVDNSAVYPLSDLIVCQNVLLYMTTEQRYTLTNRMRTAIVPDGELLVSETSMLSQTGISQSSVPQTLALQTTASPTVSLVKMIASTDNDQRSYIPENTLQQAKQAADAANWGEAHRLLDQVEAGDRLYAPLYFLRALVYEGQGQTGEAIVTLRRCLYLNRNFPIAHFTLGNLYAKTGEREQAVQSWKNTVALLENPVLVKNSESRPDLNESINDSTREDFSREWQPSDLLTSARVQLALAGANA